MHLIQFNFFPPRGNCLDFFNGEITAAPATIFFSLFFSLFFFPVVRRAARHHAALYFYIILTAG